MNPFYKNMALWLVITLMMIMLYNLFNQPPVVETPVVSYTDFLDMAENGRISEVIIQGQELLITEVSGKKFKLFAPQDNDLIRMLKQMVHVASGLMVSHACLNRRLGIFHAADADRRRKSLVFRKKPGEAVIRAIRQSNI